MSNTDFGLQYNALVVGVSLQYKFYCITNLLQRQDALKPEMLSVEMKRLNVGILLGNRKIVKDCGAVTARNARWLQIECNTAVAMCESHANYALPSERV